VAEVSAGFWHGIALRRDGSLAAWGRNHYGQTNIPANVGYVAAIAAYGSHNLVLKSDGTVVGWGDNLYGQVSVPASVTNVMAIATGFIHSLALKTNGTVVAWGDNTWGQSSVPVGLTNVIAIAAGDDHSLALKKDGSVVAWGYNGDGELNVNSPVTLVNAVAISGGMGHTLAVAPNRKPVAFAGNFSGPANHDLLVQFASSDADGDSVTYQVTSLPTQGSLYQYAGGQRGTLITDVDPIVQDTAGRVFFAPDQNGSGAPYASIGFLAGDGYAFSPAIAITINISAPVAPLIINSTSGSGGFSILASGDSNTVYCVWASTNLLDWEYQAPASQNSPGQFFFLDPAPLNQPQRFYRLSTGCQ
jgi:hypothetical protein